MPSEVNKKEVSCLLEKEIDNFHRDNMNEFISTKTGFWSRWSLLIFLCIIFLVLSFSWLIHYPDVIKTKATLIASNAPKEIIARQEGYLVKLFVYNGKKVSKGDILAFLESTASHEHVIQLRNQLDSVINDLNNNTQFISNRFTNNHKQLGELQLNYQQFISSYQQFTDYLPSGFYLKKLAVLKEDIVYLHRTHSLLEQQKYLILKDLNLSEENYKANEQLYKESIISRLDDRNEQSKLVNKQLSVPQINSSLLNNKAQQREKQKEILELEHSIHIQKATFLQSAQTFKSFIDEWEKKYLIKAPLSGKLIFLMPIQENKYIKSGDFWGFIAPLNNLYYAEILIPQYNFGKVDTNQIVQLRFDAYPYQEFGTISGRLKYISAIPTDSGFIAHVQLPFALITTQKKEIKYQVGLKAEALIITKDMLLIERLYYTFTSAFRL